MKNKRIKIGIIARCDNSGLGRMALDFYNNLPVEKVLIIKASYQNYPERFANGVDCLMGSPTLEEIDRFLEGLDVIVAFEEVYNWNAFSRAKERGIKTVLIPMYEWMPYKLPIDPDLFLCVSKKDYDEMEGNKVYIPWPIDRSKVPFKQRTKAETFIFNNGHGGFMGRNSLNEFLQAISLVKSDVKFKIRSQVLFQSVNDSRVEAEMGEMFYDNLWKEGDVFVFPHKFDGLSLPLNEAMSSGFAIITTDIYPYNEILPKELLIKPETTTRIKLTIKTRDIDAAIISPLEIAKKIDQIANQNITEYSNKSNELAEAWSWANLKNEYLKVFETLCKKP